MIAGFAPMFGKQACGAVLLEAAQQTKYLPSSQPDQRARVGDPQAPGLDAQQHLKPAELLLAHRHHRHGAPPGTPEPGGVSPLSCRGVSSLYCFYTATKPTLQYVNRSRNSHLGWISRACFMISGKVR